MGEPAALAFLRPTKALAMDCGLKYFVRAETGLAEMRPYLNPENHLCKTSDLQDESRPRSEDPDCL
jgi:hypothetical protein